METIILLVTIVLLSIAIGALTERNIGTEGENKALKESNNTMSQIIRQANIQDKAPRRIED